MLRLISSPLHQGAAPRSIELSEPACILGCAADADLVLEAGVDAPPIGRIQAVVRLRDGLCSIENLSAAGRVDVNGRRLDLRQSMGLRAGDSLRMGGHHLVLETSGGAAGIIGTGAIGMEAAAQADGMDAPRMAGAEAGVGVEVRARIGAGAGTGVETDAAQAAPAEQASTQTKEQDEAAEAEAREIFNSLLGGPGVIPVGSPTPPLPDGGETHILSDTRPTVLDDAEPLLGGRRPRDDISAVLDADQPSDRPKP